MLTPVTFSEDVSRRQRNFSKYVLKCSQVVFLIMGLQLKILSWALIIILRVRFPSGKSIGMIIKTIL